MPTVNGKRYAYTPEGRRRAAAARRQNMTSQRAGAARTQARTTAAREQAQESRTERAGMARAKARQGQARKFAAASPAGKAGLFGSKKFGKRKKKLNLRGMLARARKRGFGGRVSSYLRKRMAKG